MTSFPVDAARGRVVSALERLGFRIVREREAHHRADHIVRNVRGVEALDSQLLRRAVGQYEQRSERPEDAGLW